MQRTEIAWTEVTWNPMSGCRKISPGCKHCYAFTLAENKRGTRAFPDGFDLTIREHKLQEPTRLKQPSLVFVNSMSDLFWDEVPEQYRHAIVDVMEALPQHQFQVLTKRPEIARDFWRTRPVPSNVWCGVTIESQDYADRLDVLREIDAEIRFVSAEPLLGPVDLNLDGIHWLIAGGESGHHLTRDERAQRTRGMVRRGGRGEPRWVPTERAVGIMRSLRDQCVAQGVPFFFKQWGGPTPKSGGRTLDGRTWDEFPRYAEDRAWRA